MSEYQPDQKREAIRRVFVTATLEAAAARLKYPGGAGELMACRIFACAAFDMRTIAAYTPSDGTGVVVGPNLKTESPNS